MWACLGAWSDFSYFLSLADHMPGFGFNSLLLSQRNVFCNRVISRLQQELWIVLV